MVMMVEGAGSNISSQPCPKFQNWKIAEGYIIKRGKIHEIGGSFFDYYREGRGH